MGTNSRAQHSADWSGLDDEEYLINAAAQGDSAAFGALYDWHFERVYRHCFYCCGNHDDAEDLAQQTFLRAWEAISRYRQEEAPFVAWLLTIGQRLAFNHHRKARTARAAVPLLLSSPVNDPEVLTLASATNEALRAAILRLKPDHRQVILLRFIEEFSVAEVADALGKSENNIRVTQYRALIELRRLLEEPNAASPKSPKQTLSGPFHKRL